MTDFYIGCAILLAVFAIVVGLVIYALGFVMAIAALALATVLTCLLYVGLSLIHT